jgi:hypothetical protein
MSATSDMLQELQMYSSRRRSGLPRSGHGLAFVAIGEALEGVAGFGGDAFGGLVANGV